MRIRPAILFYLVPFIACSLLVASSGIVGAADNVDKKEEFKRALLRTRWSKSGRTARRSKYQLTRTRR